MKKFLFLPAILALGATTLLVAKVTTDFDHAADWSRYHTYSWIKVQAEDPLWNDRISAAVNAELQAKGWQMTPGGGDASVSAYGFTHTERSYQTWYDGFGGGWGWRRGWLGGPDLATTTVEDTPVGTLVVDIFDSQSKSFCGAEPPARPFQVSRRKTKISSARAWRICLRTSRPSLATKQGA